MIKFLKPTVLNYRQITGEIGDENTLVPQLPLVTRLLQTTLFSTDISDKMENIFQNVISF